ncbi:transmembrane protein 267 [Anopheles nili]|uniref:transmembrane protein 267 n=1 Tax=Anopheles nili TaxID=185578 RepID=UPI00237AAA66|nr:transmembrane protein 267 [Anopheles nili]
MNLNFALLLKHVILCLACIGGDKLGEFVQKPALLRACIDNATHALIGCIVSVIVLNSGKIHVTKQDYWMFLFEATIVSSCIDLDHFIEARSFSLKDATHLDHRPFLHNSALCLFILGLLFAIIRFDGSVKLRLFIAMAFVAFSTHHIRDATRRGIWIKTPIFNKSSPALPYVAYIAFVNFVPHAIIYLLQVATPASKTKFVELV